MYLNCKYCFPNLQKIQIDTCISVKVVFFKDPSWISWNVAVYLQMKTFLKNHLNLAFDGNFVSLKFKHLILSGSKITWILYLMSELWFFKVWSWFSQVCKIAVEFHKVMHFTHTREKKSKRQFKRIFVKLKVNNFFLLCLKINLILPLVLALIFFNFSSPSTQIVKSKNAQIQFRKEKLLI